MAVGTSILPSVSGCTPCSQAWVNTGSITNQVRNSARLTITMLGGDCCRPSACRRIDSTVTMKGNR